MPPAPPAVTSADLPALFQAADRASAYAQRRYLQLFRTDLLALAAAAALSALDLGEAWAPALRVLEATSLAFGFVVAAVLSQKSFRQRWYGGRAAAEAVRTRAWRYMMRAEPFEAADARAADGRLLDELRRLLEGTDLPGLAYDPALARNAHITDAMRAVRARPAEERRAVYLAERVRDQRAWYVARAARNERRGRAFFIASVLLQFLAFAVACALIVSPDALFGLQPLGLFTTGAAALLSWTQVRQHEELAQKYTAAALELGLLEAQGALVETEAELGAFVDEAERAMSREHTSWLARSEG